MGSRTDAMDVEARIAEALVFRGSASEALERATEALAKAASLEGVGAQTPLLERVRGWSLMQLGRVAEARVALDTALATSRAREAPYEIALTLLALAQLDRLDGTPSDGEGELESRRILADLGVLSVPDVPDAALEDDGAPHPAPR